MSFTLKAATVASTHTKVLSEHVNVPPIGTGYIQLGSSTHTEGCELGSLLGSRLGESLGLVEGTSEGLVLGTCDGSLEGL